MCLDRKPLLLLWLLVLLLGLLCVQQSFSQEEQRLLNRLESYERALVEAESLLLSSDMTLRQRSQLIESLRLELQSLERLYEELTTYSISIEEQIRNSRRRTERLEIELASSLRASEELQRSYVRVKRSRNFWRGASGVGLIIVLILLL